MNLIDELKAVIDSSEPRIRQHIEDAEKQHHPVLDALNMLCGRLAGLRWRLSVPHSLANATVSRRELDRYVIDDLLMVLEVLPELEQCQHDFALVQDLLDLQGMDEIALRDRYVEQLVRFELSEFVRSHPALAGADAAVCPDCAYERDAHSLMLRPVLRVDIKGVSRLVKAELLVGRFPDTVRAFLAAGKAVLDALTAQVERQVLAPGFLPGASELRKAEREAAFHGSCAILNKLDPEDQARLRQLLASKPNRDIFMVAARKVLG